MHAQYQRPRNQGTQTCTKSSVFTSSTHPTVPSPHRSYYLAKFIHSRLQIGHALQDLHALFCLLHLLNSCLESRVITQILFRPLVLDIQSDLPCAQEMPRQTQQQWIVIPQGAQSDRFVLELRDDSYGA